jgi:alpha-glucoside transport system substrate-binding protein
MTTSPRSRWLMAAAGASSAALILTGCSSSSETATTDGGSSAAADDKCAAYTQYGDLSGKTISVYTSIVAPEDQPHIDSYIPFEECTGADVVYEGSKEFEAQLKVRAEAGNPPDIAYIPQPGLLATLVADGYVKPAPEAVSANVDEYWGADWKAYGTVDGTFYAAPLGANVKSFVWYSPAMFADNGWEIPTTWAEMKTLSDTIAASGVVDKPWCAGIGSGDATGWPATDWMEDVMLRVNGPEVYDQWTTHEIPFNDPKVVAVLDEVGSILKNDAYVNGGLGDVKTIASTAFQEGGIPILSSACAMHRQASFYGSNFAEAGATIAEDGDVWAFYLPSVDGTSKPTLGGGEFVGAFTDRPEVQAFQAYLASAEWANNKADVSPAGWVTANKGADPNKFEGIDKLSVEILQDPATQFRFDASDLMPAAVGAGTFWTGMTDWITGKSTQDTLDFIEDSWPEE